MTDASDGGVVVTALVGDAVVDLPAHDTSGHERRARPCARWRRSASARYWRARGGGRALDRVDLTAFGIGKILAALEEG